MEEYKKIRYELGDISKIEDDISFVSRNIVYISSFLLEDVEEMIELGKLSFSYPVMRQVYEYIIILMALEDNVMTIDEFIKGKNETGFISELKKRVGTKQRAKVGVKKFKLFREFMDNLWVILCERTHANYDRLLIQNYEYDELLSEHQQLKLECELVYKLLSELYLVCVDVLLKKKHERDFEKQGKKLKFTSDVCICKSSTGITERLLKIPNSKTLFKERFKLIKEGYEEMKDKGRGVHNSDTGVTK
ncbi:hypothetical protein CI105_08935 [Candidatus Izimaplasma bacterium ZiA1]|uniref:hypothetical protein n=1 Tax=Candidatus Izimoplasma sp. ZiA1 TaxID=2024899 RepID=UPI000BAA88BE|nr:hypothetical protein CI105_08935 [Candidatus Izimaplasma bacterium ZiA1]